MLITRQLLALSRTTLREWIREKFVWTIFALCVFLFLLSLVLGEMTFAEKAKVLGDFGLSAIEISLCGLAIFSGSYLINKEIERQTCLLVLVRPLSRTRFFIGKFFGVAGLLFLFIFPGLLFMNFLQEQISFNSLLVVGLSVYLKSLVILGVVMAFSVVVRPLISLIFGASVYLLGHWLEDLRFFADKSKDESFIALAKIADWVTPNFYRFNWKSYYFLQYRFDSSEVVVMTVHFVSWTILYILFATVVFSRKDIV